MHGGGGGRGLGGGLVCVLRKGMHLWMCVHVCFCVYVEFGDKFSSGSSL